MRMKVAGSAVLRCSLHYRTVDEDENRKLLAAINAACAEPDTPEEVELRRCMRERLRRRLER